MTVCIYLAHLNPVTNAHVEIINELKSENKVLVMPVIFFKNGKEVNTKSFPFNFEIRKKMLEAVFGDAIKILPNYSFHAPFFRYLPPLLSPVSWKLRKKILECVEKENYFSYTGDKAEGYMLRLYRLNPKIGERKKISAKNVKNKLYEAVQAKATDWENDVPIKVAEIIKQNWEVLENFVKIPDMTTKIAGMKFPTDGYWSK